MFLPLWAYSSTMAVVPNVGENLQALNLLPALALLIPMGKTEVENSFLCEAGEEQGKQIGTHGDICRVMYSGIVVDKVLVLLSTLLGLREGGE